MASRRQWVALILSGVFPGLGQLYLRAWVKGVGFCVTGLVAGWTLGSLLSIEDLLAGSVPHPLLTLGLVLILLGLFLWSIVDAWIAGGKRPDTPPND